jgi:putative hydrolases of HD superfamily
VLFKSAGILKTISRKGWVKAGISNQESVADHCFRMAIIGIFLSEEAALNSAKVVRMCLIHDLAESVIGDLTPEEKVSEEAHRKDEDKICRGIFDTLPQKEKEMFLRDWSELLEGKTPEAKLVWQIDKLEMGLTMKDYLRSGGHKTKLAEFNPASYLSEELKTILNEY